MSYDDAVLYCRFCTHGGYTDWRIPTFDEYYFTVIENKMICSMDTDCWYLGDIFSGYSFIAPVRNID